MPRNRQPVSPRMQRAFEAAGCTFKLQHLGDDCHTEVPEEEAVFTMHPVYGPDGSYVGDARSGDHFRWLARMGIYAPELPAPGMKTTAVGKVTKGEHAGKWLGWSHRAAVPFGIGDKLFEERFLASDDMLFKDAGEVVITADAQARQAAVNFAEYIG